LIQTVVCVIKQFTPRVKRLRSSRELNNLRAVPKHPRIIPLLGSYSSDQQTTSGVSFDHWNLIFPFADGGDLHTLLRERDPPTWLLQAAENRGKSVIEIIVAECFGLTEALAFIHSKNNVVFIIHRDIKPSNILIQDEKFKLADFGISRIKQSEETSKTDWLSDTPLYRAPERETQDNSGRPRDIWALGCVFMELAVLMFYDWFSNFHGAGRAVQIEPAIETFEEARRAVSGDKSTAAYWQTMAVVGQWYRYMSSSYRARLYEDSKRDPMALLLGVIPAALAQDPKNRASAENIAGWLREPVARPAKRLWAGDPVIVGGT
jgi:serine/threonine protein kinase